MRRDHSAGLVAAPLVAAAALSAHALAYRLAGSDPQIAADHSAHHYLSHLPVLATPAVLLVVLALSLRLVRARSGAPTARLPLLPFALAPVPLFALQEGLEQLAHAGTLDPGRAGEATFVLGLVLAPALAVAALALGRLLLRSADGVANAPPRSFSSFPPPAPLSTGIAAAPPSAPSCFAPARPSGRAPPLAAVA